MAKASENMDQLIQTSMDEWAKAIKKEMLNKPSPYYGWEGNSLPYKEYNWRDYVKQTPGKAEKKKPDPKLVVVDLTTDQVRALLEDGDKGVQVTLDGYVVLIREV